MKKTFRLQTNKFLNVLKLLIMFPVLVFLGITAKVINFHHLELIILAITFLTILWFYRISYVGMQKVDNGEVKIRVSYNIFNSKFIKINMLLNGEKHVHTSQTSEITASFTNPDTSLSLELNMDLKSLKEPEVTIQNR